MGSKAGASTPLAGQARDNQFMNANRAAADKAAADRAANQQERNRVAAARMENKRSRF